VNTVINLRVSLNNGNFLSSCTTGWFYVDDNENVGFIKTFILLTNCFTQYYSRELLHNVIYFYCIHKCKKCKKKNYILSS
jgi:hypothetical protein